MEQSNRELWLSFITIIVISIIYLYAVISLGGVPEASELFGHSLGIIGFILMLFTETLYTLRKRSQSACWGKMSSWLQFHIFTGLVGPYMVLLHSSWKFNGLAGMLMLFTIIVVASGFLGRYIYTAVARNADGIEIQANDLEDQIRVIDGELQNRLATQPDLYRSMMGRFAPAPTFQGAGLIFGRAFDEWKSRLNWWWISSRMDRPARAQAKKIHVLLKKERNLRRQVISMAMTRRLLGLWHAIHIPVGMALFTAALIHIIAAIYYSTMLH